jgi:hypothetical protein
VCVVVQGVALCLVWWLQRVVCGGEGSWKVKRNQKETRHNWHRRRHGGTAKSACSEVVCDGTLAAVRYVSHLIMAAAYGAMTAGGEF